MRPGEILERLLEHHRARTRELRVQDLVLELQLDYSGLMAMEAYRGWRRGKHRGRRKVGLFDFKILRSGGVGGLEVRHEEVLHRAKGLSYLRSIERVYAGEDPDLVADNPLERTALREVQLAMLEQEVNWGDEEFQCWTHFSPPRGKGLGASSWRTCEGPSRSRVPGEAP